MGLVLEISLGIAFAPVVMIMGLLLLASLGWLLDGLAGKPARTVLPEIQRPKGLFDFGFWRWSQDDGTSTGWNGFSWSDSEWVVEEDPHPDWGKMTFWAPVEFEGDDVRSLLLMRQPDGFWSENPSSQNFRQRNVPKNS